MSWGYGWKPYVPVAERRRKALKKMESLRKKGADIQPVEIDGRKIAKTFWGEAWCNHLESFSDFENRLPRGRTYVRNGSVCHLAIAEGKIEAKVSGSELYNLQFQIKKLPAAKWEAVKSRCSGQIGSLIELLQGRLSDQVMEVVTDRQNGLFPLPGEMTFKCDCPDWASMCKHVAAVLYGVGARLDNKPELLFHLRGVNHEELIAADAEAAISSATVRGKSRRLAPADLSGVFGIDLEAPGTAGEPTSSSSVAKPQDNGNAPKKPLRKSAKKVVAKKTPSATAVSESPPAKKAAAKKSPKKTAKKKTAKKTAVKKAVAKTKVAKTARVRATTDAVAAKAASRTAKTPAKPTSLPAVG